MTLNTQEIRDRLDAVTPGEWRVEQHSGILYEGTPSTCAVLTTDEYDLASFGDDEQAVFDATFIAHAPADVRNLLAEVARLTAERNKLDAMYLTMKGACEHVTAERDDTSAELADMRVRYENIASSKEYTA